MTASVVISPPAFFLPSVIRRGAADVEGLLVLSPLVPDRDCDADEEEEEEEDEELVAEARCADRSLLVPVPLSLLLPCPNARKRVH